MDLGFSGIPYTYDNGQVGNRNVRVRLDRACADEAWKDLFPFTQVDHLASSCSDHCPLLVRLSHVESPKNKATPRYEIMWERHPALASVIADRWGKSKPAGTLGAVRDALKETMVKLRSWSKENFGHVTSKIEKLWGQLAELQLQDADRTLIKQKMYQLDELLYKEEMLWLQ
ncbi:uncharacterized protein [Aegilops tauschii subsp. strangulata]|uniref:uncharacterized protein n=1 Tax=Aegilops tauschii subsp. strangulata TaxID=200361 RepID=UPI003CC863E6